MADNCGGAAAVGPWRWGRGDGGACEDDGAPVLGVCAFEAFATEVELEVELRRFKPTPDISLISACYQVTSGAGWLMDANYLISRFNKPVANTIFS